MLRLDLTSDVRDRLPAPNDSFAEGFSARRMTAFGRRLPVTAVNSLHQSELAR
jgi:hypothetical protein